SRRALRRRERRRSRCIMGWWRPMGSAMGLPPGLRRGGRGPAVLDGAERGGDQGGEGGPVGHGQVGQDPTGDLEARLAEAGDEHAVARAVLAAGGVDALDPQPPEVALAGAAVAVGVLQAVHHLLVGGAVGPALVAVVALGALERDA